MNPLQTEGLATQRHALDLAAAAEGRDASGRPLCPPFGVRLGRALIGAGTRLVARH